MKPVSLFLAIVAVCRATAGVSLSTPQAHPSPPDSASTPEDLRILFWNVENFFDSRNDSTSVSDAEFSAAGELHWGWKRFSAKGNAVAKVLLWAGAPDIAAFAEVENAHVLRRLLKGTPLYKLDYRSVHYDSPDPRGIDVALLYREKRLTLLESRPFHVYMPTGTAVAGGADSLLRTRDILYCRFRDRRSGGSFSLLVCHLPSKYGGVAASSPRRAAAVRRLGALVDSLVRARSPVLVCGDFNDTPDNAVFRRLEPTLVNLSAPLHEKGEGTLRYAGKWDLIDMFWASRDLADRAHMAILRPPFLLVRDAAHGGLKPLRTYSGPRHLGGVSDHLPILLEINRFRED